MNNSIIAWGISGMAAFPFFLSGIGSMMLMPQVTKNITGLGYPSTVLRSLGVTKLLIAILYLVPQTSFIGVILSTGYLGGAIASHVRVEQKFVPPAFIAILFWVGYALRNQEIVRAALGI